MLYQSETKAQGWRAMAVFSDGRPEALLFVGRSAPQIRQEYVECFTELLDEEERDAVASIALERWTGAADAGRWMHQSNLKKPVPAGLLKVA